MTIERFYEIEEGVKGWMVRSDVGSKKDEGTVDDRHYGFLA